MTSNPASEAVDLSVVLPTYCEAESLPRLLPTLAQALDGAVLDGAGLRWEVIVVDDASPDGTADVARELAKRWPIEILERRGERGLASAVMAGFAHARGEICAVMDADGSHPVEALPKLVEAVRSGGAEIAVGSRLAPGGGFDGWPLPERAKSRFAAVFARGLTRLSDPTSGLMAVRRSLLTDLDLDPIGWKIVLEVVVKAAPRPFVEVPIIFGPRLAGRSKQNLNVYWQYLRHCIKLYAYSRRGSNA